MKIPQQPSNRKRNILIASAIVLLSLLAVGTAYMYRLGPFHSNNTPAINLAPATDEQKKAGTEQKQTTQSKDTPQKTPAGTTPPADVNNTNALAVKITALNQNGSLVQIRSLIETVSNSGTCTLTLTKDSVTVTKTSDIQALPSSSTCKGFDVPTSELSSGTWNVSILVNINGDTGIATGKITVQ